MKRFFQHLLFGLAIAFTSVSTVSMVGCDNGGLEEVGEDIDEGLEDIGEGIEDAGEEIEDGLKKKN